MHMHHHQKGRTIMGCLDEIQRTKFHQNNLQYIYNHTCECQYPPNGQFQNLSTSLRMSQRYTHGHNNAKHKHSHNYNKHNHACIDRLQKNNKLTELHRMSYLVHQNMKDKEIYQQNKKLVKKLLNIKSDLQQYNSPSKKDINLYQTQNLQITNRLTQKQSEAANLEQQNLFITANVNSFMDRTSRGIKSHSAVNRVRNHKKIQSENKQLKDRLISAMSKSQYSQSSLRKWSKNSNKRNLISIKMNRSLSSNFYKPKTNNDKPIQQQVYQNRLENQNEQGTTLNQRQSVPHKIKSPYLATTYKISQRNKKAKIKTQPDEQMSTKQTKRMSKNQLTNLFHQSITYIQNDGYKIQKTLKNSAFDRSNNKLNLPITTIENEQRQTQSMSKMRRAAMLHFRKIQKMKSTQSKFWQLSNRLETQKKDKQKMSKINNIMLTQP